MGDIFRFVKEFFPLRNSNTLGLMCLPMSDFIISFNIAYFPIFFFVDDIVFTLKTYQVKPALVLAAFILGLKMNDPEIAGLLSGWVNSPRGCNLVHN